MDILISNVIGDLRNSAPSFMNLAGKPFGTLTGGPMCRESHPLCRLKNPKVVYMITCRLSSCKTGVYNILLLIILQRGCSSIYGKRKKKIATQFFGSSLGNQTNPATISATGYSRPTGTAPKTFLCGESTQSSDTYLRIFSRGQKRSGELVLLCGKKWTWKNEHVSASPYFYFH